MTSPAALKSEGSSGPASRAPVAAMNVDAFGSLAAYTTTSRPAPSAAFSLSTTDPSIASVTTAVPSIRIAGSTSGSAARTTSRSRARSTLTVRS